MIVSAILRTSFGFDSCSIPWNSNTAVFVPNNAAIIVHRLSWEEVRLSTLTEPSLMKSVLTVKGLYVALDEIKKCPN